MNDRLATALKDRYTIERELGAGGMATVYLARDLKHEREVAIKVLREDLSASLGSARFLREIKIAAQLQHPHILPLLDSGEADGFLFFVMPYIKGQSLRERLAREGELPVHETVRLLTGVVDALVEAHAHGIVHRDIKPDNVMLSGRHALVTDFGVAKAISEATGRNTVTTLGVAVGTPIYMSPEQAAADPHVDHRSDIYSVGVMAYEMLSGRPPFTGNTPQQVLAAHVTEAPDPVSKRRPAIPPALEAIVMRCLAKRPADRFQTAAELYAALEPLATPSTGITPTQTRPIETVAPQWSRARSMAVIAGLAGGIVVASAAWLLFRAHGLGPATPKAFRARTQVTFTGNASRPALSADGKQLAYVVQQCGASGCSYGLDVQDVDGPTTRRLVDSVSSIFDLQWSPDRRFLIFFGRLGSRTGSFLVSTLGGAPRYLGLADASFLWAGDSMLSLDTTEWAKTETLDGATRDSFRVSHSNTALFAFPGDRWLLTGSFTDQRISAIILDRSGRQNDALALPPGSSIPRVGGEAAWFPVSLGGNRSGVVRLPVDLGTGKFRPPLDTVLDAAGTTFDVSADGGTVAYLEGVRGYDLWVMPLTDALQGHFTPEHHILPSTSRIDGSLSPDGTRLLIDHSEAGPAGKRTVVSIRLLKNGVTVDLVPGEHYLGDEWAADGKAIIAVFRAGAQLQFVNFDGRTAVRGSSFSIDDSTAGNFDALPGGGFAWVSGTGDRIRVQQHEHEKPRDLLLPAGEHTENVNASLDGTRLVTMVNIGPTRDSVAIDVISLADGRVGRWLTMEGDQVSANWLNDGSLRVIVQQTASATIYRVVGPGQMQRLGTIPRAVLGLDWSRDGRTVTVTTSDLRGDIWLARSAAPRP